MLRAIVIVLVALAGSARAEPVELSLLSYNTHGLASWIVDDEPELRFPRISALLDAYDVALIQEDWSHHEALVEAASHQLIERGNDSRLWLARILPIFGGSGLTTLVRSRAWLVQIGKEPYGVCAGWLGGANDCFATKGFLYVRLRFSGGRVLDIYQTHLDAGGSAEDQAAREHQLAQLAHRIRSLSEDGPLVLAGDFNLRAEVPEQRAALDAFTQSLALRDSGAGPAPGSGWRTLDYVFYRPGRDVELELLEAGEALEFRDGATPLSDHPALYARFRIR